MRRLIVIALLALLAGRADAETLQVCYHYACSKVAAFDVDDDEIARMAEAFRQADSARTERKLIARTVWHLYALAARSSPIWQDTGQDRFDNDGDGRMDCIDHSTNVTTFLMFMEDRHWLRFHAAAPVIRRNMHLVNQHFAGHIIERETAAEWAVDSWFNAFGALPVIVPLQQWKEGFYP